MSKKNRRQQTPKPHTGNEALMHAMQELRRSSAAQPHANKARYSRKVKHKNKEW